MARFIILKSGPGALLKRFEIVLTILMFSAGFAFNFFTQGRIDAPVTLIKHGIYLLILGLLLILEILIKVGSLSVSEKWKKTWNFHSLIVHFIFGTLLAANTIYYYTSASAITSFIYIILLVALLFANEIKKFRSIGLPVRIVLYNICSLSFFEFFWPIILKHLGALPFWLGIINSFLAMFFIWQISFRKARKSEILNKEVVYPTLIVHALFIFSYYTSLIPPVPVAVKKIGVYHEVIKEDGKYLGRYLPSEWKTFNFGPRIFRARAGDKVIILLSIFAPTQFEDSIFLKWYRQTPDENVLEDTIPISILGGRNEGFRGFGSKQFYNIGHWKVIVETSDGREVGSINIEIIKDETTGLRNFNTDFF